MRSTFVILILLFGFSACQQEDVAKDLKKQSFADRETVMTLVNEPGRINYQCEGDSTFIYLKPDNSEIPLLFFEDEEKIKDFFGFLPYGLIYQQSSIDFLFCTSDYEIAFMQNTEFPIIISGLVKSSLDRDSIVAPFAPFVIDTLTKIHECRVDYLVTNDTFELLDTRWQVIDIIKDGDTLSPSCEYNAVSLIFDTSNSEIPFIMDPNTGDDTCGFTFEATQNSINIVRGGCILSFPDMTPDMSHFSRQFFEVLQVWGSDSGHVSYIIQNNLLTLTNEVEGSKIRLYANE